MHNVLLAGLNDRVGFVPLADQIASQTVIKTYNLLFETVSFDPLTLYSFHNYVIQVVSVSDACTA